MMLVSCTMASNPSTPDPSTPDPNSPDPNSRDPSPPDPTPDYDLADRLVLTTPDQVKAIGHELRTAILGLLHERAASVTELAAALDRPRSTVAYHVDLLAEAGLVRVVRTRRVRAVEERFFGRTARLFHVGGLGGDEPGDLPLDFNDFEVAARESAVAFSQRRLWGFIRHARISPEVAGEFWEAMADLVGRFETLPRSGQTVYGFALGIYPTDGPVLPPPSDPASGDAAVGSGDGADPT